MRVSIIVDTTGQTLFSFALNVDLLKELTVLFISTTSQTPTALSQTSELLHGRKKSVKVQVAEA
jgi:hypothetical protein